MNPINKGCIGPAGDHKRIIAENGVKIAINDDGRFYCYRVTRRAGQKPLSQTDSEGDRRRGQPWNRIPARSQGYAFGAFVEFLPGKEGLVHLSKLDTKRVNKVEDIVAVGDMIPVKVLEVDSQGRINLSRKDALNSEQAD